MCALHFSVQVWLFCSTLRSPWSLVWAHPSRSHVWWAAGHHSARCGGPELPPAAVLNGGSYQSRTGTGWRKESSIPRTPIATLSWKCIWSWLFRKSPSITMVFTSAKHLRTVMSPKELGLYNLKLHNWTLEVRNDCIELKYRNSRMLLWWNTYSVTVSFLLPTFYIGPIPIPTSGAYSASPLATRKCQIPVIHDIKANVSGEVNADGSFCLDVKWRLDPILHKKWCKVSPFELWHTSWSSSRDTPNSDFADSDTSVAKFHWLRHSTLPLKLNTTTICNLNVSHYHELQFRVTSLNKMTTFNSHIYYFGNQSKLLPITCMHVGTTLCTQCN